MHHQLKHIHIFHDDKFVNNVIDVFEQFQQNKYDYYIFVNDRGDTLKYVDSKKVNAIHIYEASERIAFANYINKNNSVVYLHALDAPKQSFIKHIHLSIIKVWFIWGFDLYNAWPVLNNRIYQPATLATGFSETNLKNKGYTLKSSYFGYLLFLSGINLPYFFYKKTPYRLLTRLFLGYYDAVKTIDIAVPVVKTEMGILKKMKINPLYAPFRYVYLEKLFGEDFKALTTETGDNILVGNSAAPSSNHLEVFEKLSELELFDRKIIVPLSYSGSEDYINKIVAKGKLLFGENFVPILRFIPANEYSDIIASCGFLIFNHIRQQGVGNLVEMGYRGSKMILNKKSPVFKRFKEIGIFVESIDQLSQNMIDTSLTPMEILQNRKILENLYSLQSVLAQVKELNNTVDFVSKSKSN